MLTYGGWSWPPLISGAYYTWQKQMALGGKWIMIDQFSGLAFSLILKKEHHEIMTQKWNIFKQFEQDPNQILDALLPLYMNSQILRALQESLASELAARMNAMSNASDNAKDLSKRLTLEYNRKRQAKITAEIIELVAGASAA